MEVRSDAPAEVFAVPAVVNSWVLPWTTQELREAQLADPELKVSQNGWKMEKDDHVCLKFRVLEPLRGLKAWLQSFCHVF